MLYQIGKYMAHSSVGGRWSEFFGRFFFWFYRSMTAAQQQRHSVGVAQMAEPLYEADGIAALTGGVIIPAIAPYGNAVVTGKTLVPPGGQQRFAAALQERFQICGCGPVFLFLCEVDVWGHGFLLR